jgi:hypothetical protein
VSRFGHHHFHPHVPQFIITDPLYSLSTDSAVQRRNNSVGITSGWTRPGFCSRQEQDFSFLHTVQIVSGGPWIFPSTGYRGVKSTAAWNLNTQIYLCSMSRTLELYLNSPNIS